VAVDWQEPTVLRAAEQIVVIQLHTLTYNCTRGMQPANTPPLQWTTPGLHPIRIHQMAPPMRGSRHSIRACKSTGQESSSAEDRRSTLCHATNTWWQL